MDGSPLVAPILPRRILSNAQRRLRRTSCSLPVSHINEATSTAPAAPFVSAKVCFVMLGLRRRGLRVG
jgi:hypothetical protein